MVDIRRAPNDAKLFVDLLVLALEGRLFGLQGLEALVGGRDGAHLAEIDEGEQGNKGEAAEDWREWAAPREGGAKLAPEVCDCGLEAGGGVDVAANPVARIWARVRPVGSEAPRQAGDMWEKALSDGHVGLLVATCAGGRRRGTKQCRCRIAEIHNEETEGKRKN
jgi:hypothetical protein